MRKVSKIDKKYLDELNKLYKLSVKMNDVPSACFVLEKMRNMELYLDKPAKEKPDTSV